VPAPTQTTPVLDLRVYETAVFTHRPSKAEFKKLLEYFGMPRQEDPNRALREMVKVLSDDNRRLEHQMRAVEYSLQREELYKWAVDGALLAVRVLAKVVSSKTADGRRARAEARQLLEERGIRPPGTLGASRKRRKRRRQHPIDRTK
jgi:hypothetical protein